MLARFGRILARCRPSGYSNEQAPCSATRWYESSITAGRGQRRYRHISGSWSARDSGEAGERTLWSRVNRRMHVPHFSSKPSAAEGGFEKPSLAVRAICGEPLRCPRDGFGILGFCDLADLHFRRWSWSWSGLTPICALRCCPQTDACRRNGEMARSAAAVGVTLCSP